MKWIFICTFVLVLAGCSDRKSQYTGTWVSPNDNIRLLKDGTLMTSGFAGTWKMDDDNKGIIIQLSMMGMTVAAPGHLENGKLILSLNNKLEVLTKTDDP
jgi:hypothetical protein